MFAKLLGREEGTKNFVPLDKDDTPELLRIQRSRSCFSLTTHRI